MCQWSYMRHQINIKSRQKGYTAQIKHIMRLRELIEQLESIAFTDGDDIKVVDQNETPLIHVESSLSDNNKDIVLLEFNGTLED